MIIFNLSFPVMIQMNRNILKEEIQWILEAIQEQYAMIRGYEEKIPRIEFDIIMENIRRLYEKLYMLERSGDPFTFHEHKTLEVIRDQYGEVPGNEHAVPEALTGEMETAPQPAHSREKKEPVKADPSPQADLFSDQGAGFTEKLKQAREKSLGPKFKSAAPESLKSTFPVRAGFSGCAAAGEAQSRVFRYGASTLKKPGTGSGPSGLAPCALANTNSESGR